MSEDELAFEVQKIVARLANVPASEIKGITKISKLIVVEYCVGMKTEVNDLLAKFPKHKVVFKTELRKLYRDNKTIGELKEFVVKKSRGEE